MEPVDKIQVSHDLELHCDKEVNKNDLKTFSTRTAVAGFELDVSGTNFLLPARAALKSDVTEITACSLT